MLSAAGPRIKQRFRSAWDVESENGFTATVFCLAAASWILKSHYGEICGSQKDV
jgi:hypothetical protein